MKKIFLILASLIFLASTASAANEWRAAGVPSLFTLVLFKYLEVNALNP